MLERPSFAASALAGAAPVRTGDHAEGDEVTGVCVIRLVAGLDRGRWRCGKSRRSARTKISGSLSARLAEIGGDCWWRLSTVPAAGNRVAGAGEDGLTYAERSPPGIVK